MAADGRRTGIGPDLLGAGQAGPELPGWMGCSYLRCDGKQTKNHIHFLSLKTINRQLTLCHVDKRDLLT